MCRGAHLDVWSVDPYWKALWKEVASTVLPTVRCPETRAVVDEVRKLGKPPPRLPVVPPRSRLWGFREMFRPSKSQLPEGWDDRMARSIVPVLVAGESVVLIVRRSIGRNLLRHEADGVVIDEVVRWRLTVQPRTPAPRVVPCAWCARQLRLSWTTRYDPRLPASEDGSRYPFCPPRSWSEKGTPAVRTVEGKPAFIDAHDNGWTRPRIHGGRGLSLGRLSPGPEPSGADRTRSCERCCIRRPDGRRPTGQYPPRSKGQEGPVSGRRVELRFMNSGRRRTSLETALSVVDRRSRAVRGSVPMERTP